MRKNKTDVARRLLDECLNNLESNKPCIAQSLQKLMRASSLLENKEINDWCESQLGDSKYNKLYINMSKRIKDNTINKTDVLKEANKVGINTGLDNFMDEVIVRYHPASAGDKGIVFAEQMHNNLTKQKLSNDGTYYIVNLSDYINYVSKETHFKTTKLFNEIEFSHMPSTTFDILREEVEDKLFEIEPELTEQLIKSFIRVKSTSEEDWAQALTTCRRIVNALADELFPPQDSEYKQRAVLEKNYINRLWAFMDMKIESKTNKELAQKHLEYTRVYLEKNYRLLNKGVHSTVDRLDAIKAIHHTYLLLADILFYCNLESLDDSERFTVHDLTYNIFINDIGLKPNIVKSIIRYRANNPKMCLDDLLSIEGLGKKTYEKITRFLKVQSV